VASAVLPAIGVGLFAALAGGGLLLARLNAAQRLRARVRALSGDVDVAGLSALPNIQVQVSNQGAGMLRFLGMLRYRADLPKAQVIPWPMVLFIAVAVGLLVFSQAWTFLGLGYAIPLGLGTAAQLARVIFGWQRERYCKAVFEQIPEAVGLMVRAIRAGLPMAEALRTISREMASPTKDEFSRVVGDIAIGRPVEVALMKLHDRTGLTEYSFLAVTLGLQSQTGGSLAETLENLGEMVRKRVALAKRASALAGEAKVQAGMLLVMPFLAAAGLSFIQPFYISAFLETSTGNNLLIIGFGLMVLGVLTIRQMIRGASAD
jgi:tight adherence protein B